MGEKRGFTGKSKLKMDFPVEAVLEIFFPKTATWARVTAGEFRSWSGRRRITTVKQPGIGNDFSKVESTTTEYYGPVYFYGTNIVSTPDSSQAPTMMTTPEKQELQSISNNRKR